MVTQRIAAVLLGIVFSACRGQGSASAQRTLVPPPPPAGASRPIDAQRRTAIVDASAKAAPAVVSIHTILPTARTMSLFGVQTETPQGFGTGFVFRADGYIVTNQHVVENAQQITVTLSDGTDADGRVVGEDPVTDIAVIKVNRSGLTAVMLGRSSDLLIGEWAIALGNPYAYLLGNSEPTVTAGVISAIHRNILSAGNLQGVYVDMIQTDAAINPGNSGGPLVNALGEVIGVNSSIFSNTGESVGLGFSIPIERAVRVANEIIATTTVRRAWPGLDVNVSRDITDHKNNGVTVRSVAPDGPAARAGIKPGDVLLRANGKVLRTYLDWEAVKLDLKVGEAITVSAKSGATTNEHHIVTGDLPTVTAGKVRVLQGMDLVTVTPAVRAERNIQIADGALVLKINKDISDQTGIEQGDVIFGLNQQQMHTAEAVSKALGAVRTGQVFYLSIERAGRRGQIPLRMNQ